MPTVNEQGSATTGDAASLLAKARPTAGLMSPSSVAQVDHVVFELAGQRYALPVSLVREVLPRATLARVPEGPIELAGVLRLRGALLPVVDLRRRLGLAEITPRIDQRIVVAIVGAAGVGLLVDAVHGLQRFAEPPADPSPDGALSIIRAVVETPDQVVLLLNLAAIASGEMDRVLSSLHAERSALSAAGEHEGGRVAGTAE